MEARPAGPRPYHETLLDRHQFALAGHRINQALPTAPRGQVKRLEVEPALGAVHLALAEVQGGGARIPSYWS